MQGNASKILWNEVLLEEAYRLKPTKSQVLRGAMELILQSRSTKSKVSNGSYEIVLPSGGTWSDFLEKSRESKRLGNKKDEPNKACFKELHLESTKIRTLQDTHRDH